MTFGLPGPMKLDFVKMSVRIRVCLGHRLHIDVEAVGVNDGSLLRHDEKDGNGHD